jgi:pSer/pThr/pTyr-binding forkhead associated (FHA) protein
MPEHLRVERPDGTSDLALESTRVTVGADPSNDVAVSGDEYVSRLHAVLERLPAGWLIRDLGSRNGTYVNGERITAERALHPGDSIVVGHTTMAFVSDDAGARRTQVLETMATPPSTSTGGASMLREGDYWTLVFGKRTSRVRDSKGMRYLHTLLAAPGREVHVLDLVAADEGVASSALPASDAGEVLDSRAKDAYRRRMEDLAEELEEAQRFNDDERAARASEEIDALTDQLAAAVGLGGRDRKAASTAERARLNVTRAVRSALKRIAEVDSQAGRHLDVCVRTGVFCCYQPDPASPITWQTADKPD